MRSPPGVVDVVKVPHHGSGHQDPGFAQWVRAPIALICVGTPDIGWFADLTLADRPAVGGKGASLGELTRAGIAVPPGFVVEKVAGPPLVRYPLFAAFDDRGRLFVAEGTGTNDQQLGVSRHR